MTPSFVSPSCRICSEHIDFAVYILIMQSPNPGLNRVQEDGESPLWVWKEDTYLRVLILRVNAPNSECCICSSSLYAPSNYRKEWWIYLHERLCYPLFSKCGVSTCKKHLSLFSGPFLWWCLHFFLVRDALILINLIWKQAFFGVFLMLYRNAKHVSFLIAFFSDYKALSHGTASVITGILYLYLRHITAQVPCLCYLRGDRKLLSRGTFI